MKQEANINLNTILFSPVGNSDPWRNGYDGAMLHIVRHYQPQLVVLFFTESIWESGDKRSGLNAYDWPQIIKAIQPSCEVRILVEPIENPSDFDGFKAIFNKYLTDLHTEFPNREILLNVTSGTPQMETTLCLEYVTYPNNKRSIQVTNPLLASNARRQFATPENQHTDFEQVNSQERTSPSRCKEIQIISFREAITRGQMKSLLDSYDYHGAKLLSENQKGMRNFKLITRLLREKVDGIQKHIIFSDLAAKYSDEQLQKTLFHYLLLDMRFKRGDVAETLIRVKSIAEFIAEQYLNKYYPDLICYVDNKPYLNRYYKDTGFYDKYLKIIKLKTNGKIKHINYDSILGLPAYIDALSALADASGLYKNLWAILQINGLRNSVAHNLAELDLDKDNNGKNIKKAVVVTRKMVETLYPDIEVEDYDYFNNFNEHLKELI